MIFIIKVVAGFLMSVLVGVSFIWFMLLASAPIETFMPGSSPDPTFGFLGGLIVFCLGAVAGIGGYKFKKLSAEDKDEIIDKVFPFVIGGGVYCVLFIIIIAVTLFGPREELILMPV